MQPTNTYGTVRVAEIRDYIKEFFDITDTKRDKFITLTIMRGAKAMLSYKMIVQKCITIDLCDFRAELPCDFQEAIYICTTPNSSECGCPNDNNCAGNCNYSQPFIYTGNNLNYINQGYNSCNLYNTRTFSLAPPDTSVWSNKNTGIISFSPYFTGKKIDMRYFAYNCDTDGSPLLMDSHYDWYVLYASAWYCLKMKDSRYTTFKKDAQGYLFNTIRNENIDVLNREALQVLGAIKLSGITGGSYGINYWGGINNGLSYGNLIS